ncbi:unnamed protein product, partial [Didymodactylos carnosus]
MDQILSQTNILIREVEHDLVSYENAKTKTSENECEQVINEKLGRLLQMCDRLDILINKESVSKRPQLRQRMNEIKYDMKHYQAAFSNISRKKQQHEQEERARDLLLTRKFGPNTTVTSRTATDSGDTQIQLDHALDYSDRLDSTHMHVDNILSQAQSVLGNLRTQDLTLKGVRTKLISMGNTLGLSSTLIRSIERRAKSDWFILFGGMILTFKMYYFSVILFGLLFISITQSKKKDLRDYSDDDIEKLYQQWEENDSDKLSSDEQNDYYHRYRQQERSYPDLSMNYGEEKAKIMKKGLIQNLFVTLSGKPTKRETEDISEIWYLGLKNALYDIRKYVIDDDRVLFVAEDGSQSFDIKDFLIQQDRCNMVSIDNQVYYSNEAK